MKTSAITAALFVSIAGMRCGPGQASGDCWLDIYDKTDFQGAHERIEGPVDVPKLDPLRGSNWANRIESLAVGSKAEVTVFKLENYRVEEQGPAYHGEAIKAWGEKPETYGEGEMTFGPGKKEHHLGELRFHQNINSLIIRCQK